MILTVIRGRELDISLAGIAAAALCYEGLTRGFPPDPEDPNKDDTLPSRPAVADGGSLEVQCDGADAPLVRAGFVRAGFDTIEKVPDPTIPPKGDPVSVAITAPAWIDVRYVQKIVEMVDPACDALCGAGLTVAYPDGRSYSGNLSKATTFNVQCGGSDVPVVNQTFDRLWKFLYPTNPTGDGFLSLARTLRTLQRLSLGSQNG